jgi:hypothetical protein
MMSVEALRRRGSRWNPEVGMRYMPILRQVRRERGRPTIVDIGSGPSGASPYWRGTVLSFDLEGEPGGAGHVSTIGSILDLPVADAAAPVVLCLDVLEHLSPAARAAAIDELVRVAGDLLFIAVPTGREAAAHDAEMAAVYERHRGEVDRFYAEHLDNGLPDEHELLAMVHGALDRVGRSGVVRATWNCPLRTRSFIITRFARRSALDHATWLGLLLGLPILSRLKGRPAYRLIVRVDLAPGEAAQPALRSVSSAS